MTIIEYPELPEELTSSYLRRYQEVEGLRIHTVRMDLEARTAEALLDVEAPLNTEDFHLPQNLAYLIVGQLMVAYTCKELETDKENFGTHTQFEQESHNKRPIFKQRDIKFKVQFEEEEKTKRDKKTRIKTKCSYDVENGSFTGHFKLVYFQP